MRSHPKSGLTDAESSRLERELLEARQLILSRMQERLREDRERDEGGVLDPMDAATQEEQRSIPHLLGDAEGERLAEIDHALAKIAAGTYGVSERSGEPIGFERLSVEPWARFVGRGRPCGVCVRSRWPLLR